MVGCKTITESEIRACIAEEGLYEGALKRFDCDAIERKLFSQFDNVVWARVAYEGNYVQVEISESEQVPASDTSREKPCSIVADQECYIETVYTYKGRAEVQEGDFVRKGQVLISGRVPDRASNLSPGGRRGAGALRPRGGQGGRQGAILFFLLYGARVKGHVGQHIKERVGRRIKGRSERRGGGRGKGRFQWRAAEFGGGEAGPGPAAPVDQRKCAGKRANFK